MNVEDKDFEGNTILHICAARGSLKCFSCVLEQYDTYLLENKNDENLTPIQLSKRYGNYYKLESIVKDVKNFGHYNVEKNLPNVCIHCIKKRLPNHWLKAETFPKSYLKVKNGMSTTYNADIVANINELTESTKSSFVKDFKIKQNASDYWVNINKSGNEATPVCIKYYDQSITIVHKDGFESPPTMCTPPELAQKVSDAQKRNIEQLCSKLNNETNLNAIKMNVNITNKKEIHTHNYYQNILNYWTSIKNFFSHQVLLSVSTHFLTFALGATM
ncbi:hypothetical protein A3Q56_02351 [Intoshia linei]|uniref:Uncharacterized protein n=1 Tax=Intoshia linei TaxID=1819745 RepID=A0A177B8M8_9BILA|nr:hypothetical protein A3Q56_02351 [Intoshia linei]